MLKSVIRKLFTRSEGIFKVKRVCVKEINGNVIFNVPLDGLYEMEIDYTKNRVLFKEVVVNE